MCVLRIELMFPAIYTPTTIVLADVSRRETSPNDVVTNYEKETRQRYTLQMQQGDLGHEMPTPMDTRVAS